MAIGDVNRIAECARRLVLFRQFSNLALQTILTSLGTGIEAAQGLGNVNLQKAVSREVRIWGASADGQEFRWAGPAMRWVVGGKKGGKSGASSTIASGGGSLRGKERAVELDVDEDEEDHHEGDEAMEGDVPKPIRPTQPNPIVNTYYACMLMMTKSYHSSICKSLTCFWTHIEYCLTKRFWLTLLSSCNLPLTPPPPFTFLRLPPTTSSLPHPSLRYESARSSYLSSPRGVLHRPGLSAASRQP